MASTDFRVKNGLTVDTTALISSTADATNKSTGGSLTVSGGAAIAKKLFVGTSIGLPGSSSGTATLQATAAAGTPTLSLPTTTGTLIGTGDNGTVTSTMIENGTIVDADISSSAAIAVSKLAASTISGVTLGSNLSSLSVGTGLTYSVGSAFNGSAASTLTIANTVALRADTMYIGTTGVALNRTSGAMTLSGITSIDGGSGVNQSLTIQSTTGIGTGDSILFKVGDNGTITAMTINTSGNITASGNVTISGNLIVNGVTTSVNSSTVTVDDKNIELASVASGVISATGTVGSITGSGPWTATITGMTTTTGLIVGSTISAGVGTGSLYGGSPITVVVSSIVSSTSITYTVTGGSATTPVAGTVTNITTNGATNVTADGAGITVKGTTDKTFNWVNSTTAWTSSENIDLASGKAYYIAGSSVLSASTYVGNAASATKLATARNINGVSFDGSADITISAGTATKATNLVGGNATTQYGSMPYQTAVDTTSLLAPNTTATKKFLRMTGDGTNGAAPAWDTIVAGDVPTLNQNTTGSAGKATNLVGGNNTTGLGSIPYQSNTDTTTLLAPNTVATRKFLTQTGTGTNGAAPVWSQTYTTSSGAPSSPVVGDLWYKSTSDIFYVYVNDGTSSFWLSLNTYPSSFSNLAVTTALTVSGTVSSNLTPTTTNLYTLGTASLLWSNVYATTFTGALSGTATNSTNAAITADSASTTCYVTFVTATSGNAAIRVNSNMTYNASTNVLTTTATQSRYADLAEKYTADADYETGTVLDFGGANEVTISAKDMSRKIAGVVSTNPGYLMNAELESEFVITLALAGRVPCKVQGTIRKGDMMVSAGNGYARAEEDPKLGSVIGKALEDFDGETGIIEVVVGRL